MIYKYVKGNTLIARRAALQIVASSAIFAPAIVSAVAQTKYKIKIINTSSNTVQTIQELVRMLGYFDEFGLDVEVLNVSDGSKVMASLISGEVDACMLSGFGQVVPAIEKGANLKIIAGALLKSNSLMYTSSPDIKTVKDLVGKTIGTGAVGSGLHTLVVALLRKNGIDESKVRFQNAGSGTDVFKAVAAGIVDAGPAQVEFMDQAKRMNIRALPDGAFWEQLPQYSDQGSYTADRTIAGRRDALVRLLAAYGKTYRFVSGPDSRDAYMKARVAALGDKADIPGGEALWRFIQDHQPYALNLTLSEPRIAITQDVNLELGSQKIRLPYEKVVDASIARDAVQLIGGPVNHPG
jgi:ABC-type nitrate/sulfonate/bicarbonate transport system substrate-binding protein